MILGNKKINKIAVKVILLFMLSFLLMPSTVLAEPMAGCEVPTATDARKPIRINFPLPNITKGPIYDATTNTNHYEVKNLSCFVVGIYVYFAGVAGILATVMIMYGGVKYLISMGSPQRMSDAKDTIFSAVVGLVLVLGAYILLNLINPNLVELKTIEPNTVLPIYDLAPCPSDTSLANPEVPDARACGDFGILVNGGSKCYYDSCPTDDVKCLAGDEENPYSGNFTCRAPSTSCTSVDDENAPTQDQSACDRFSVDGEGICLWMDRSWYDVADWDDECVWFNQINCYNATWSQVNCSECVGEYDADDYECVSTPAYKDDPRVEKDQGICCKKVDQPKPNYPIGELFFSTTYHNQSFVNAY